MAAKLLFLLACFGCAHIVHVLVIKSFLDRKPFNCSLCMGFWAAFIFLTLKRFVLTPFGYEMMIMVFAAAGFSYALTLIVERKQL